MFEVPVKFSKYLCKIIIVVFCSYNKRVLVLVDMYTDKM